VEILKTLNSGENMLEEQSPSLSTTHHIRRTVNRESLRGAFI
jgi:hypothetical protein